MKKSIIAIALIVCMIMPAMGMAAYTPGEYTAEAQGFSSAVKATVTVDGDKITAVALDVSGETAGFGAAQGEALAAAFMEKQSAEIDGVSGVTLTSNAAKAAVQKALDEAAGAAGWNGTYVAGTYTGVRRAATAS